MEGINFVAVCEHGTTEEVKTFSVASEEPLINLLTYRTHDDQDFTKKDDVEELVEYFVGRVSERELIRSFFYTCRDTDYREPILRSILQEILKRGEIIKSLIKKHYYPIEEDKRLFQPDLIPLAKHLVTDEDILQILYWKIETPLETDPIDELILVLDWDGREEDILKLFDHFVPKNPRNCTKLQQLFYVLEGNVPDSFARWVIENEEWSLLELLHKENRVPKNLL